MVNPRSEGLAFAAPRAACKESACGRKRGPKARARSEVKNVKGPHTTERSLKEVSRTFASWNVIGDFLRRLDGLKRAVAV
jgi:hypothetical protein